MPAPRPFGSGPYGNSYYWPTATYTYVSGASLLGFNVTGELIRTWQPPTQMCETGTWTLTSLPDLPPNDQLELVP